MKFTTNLNLKKPDYTDPVDIGDINGNMDIVDSAIQSKADNTRVLTDVPSGAKFTDTVTTINGKTGTIAKADIVALGIPAQDTTYGVATTSANGLMSSTDKTKLNGIATGATANTGTVTSVSAGNGLNFTTITGTGAVTLGTPSTVTNATTNSVTSTSHTHALTLTKADITALGIPAQDTVYTHPTGTNPHGTTKTDVGLSLVDNVKLMPISGGVLENYTEKIATVSVLNGNIDLSQGNVFQHTPSGNRTYVISSAVNGQANSFTLIINMGSTVRTLTFPSSIKWQGGEIPDMTTANKTYVLTFMSVDGGTNWLGMFGGEF